MPSSRYLPTAYNISTYGDVTRDYTVLATWEAATDIDLVTATDGEVLECYDDAASFDDYVDLAGATCNASYFRVIKPATGQGHDGTPLNGVYFVCTTAAHVFTISETYSQIQDLIAKVNVNDAGTSPYSFAVTGHMAMIVGCIAYASVNADAVKTGNGFWASAGDGITNGHVNCLAVDCEGNGFINYPTHANGVCFNYNCAAHGNATGFLAYDDFAAHIAKNCIADGNTIEWNVSLAGVWTKTTCLDGDDIPRVYYKDSGNDDYHLIGTSIDSINQATDLSSDATYPFNDDLDNNTRGVQCEYGSNWDIGVFEYQGTIVISGDEAKVLVEFLLSSFTKRRGTSFHVDRDGNPFLPGLVDEPSISKEVDDLAFGIQGRSSVKVAMANKHPGIFDWEIDDETGATWGPSVHGLSFADSSAFIATSGLSLGTLYGNKNAIYRLDLHDSANKLARGFIGEAGAGLSVSTAMGTNQDFEIYAGVQDDGTSDTFTDWTTGNINDGIGDKVEATATKYAGTNAVKITQTSVDASAPYIRQAYAGTAGRLYRFRCYTRGDGALDGRYWLTYEKADLSWGNMSGVVATGVTDATYSLLTVYFTIPLADSTGAATGNFRIFLYAKQGGVAYFDSLTVVRLSAPSATTGVVIYKEPGGAEAGKSRGWEFIDAAFNYNDSTYTLEVLACSEYWSHIVTHEEIRGRWGRVHRYLPEDGQLFEYRGRIVDYELTSGQIDIFLEMMDDEILDTILPQKVVTTDLFSATALDVGAPVNICIGYCRGVPLYNIKNDLVNNYYDYLIGYGVIEGLWTSSGGRGVQRDGETIPAAEYTFYDGSGAPYAGYACIRFTTEQMSHAGAMHNITADVKGLEMGGSAAQRNFATVLYTLLTNATYGLNDSADSDSFTAAATALSALGNMYCDGFIGEQRMARDWIESIMEPARSTLKRGTDGEWEITVDQTGSSVMTFGCDDGFYNNCEVVSYSRTPSREAIKTAKIRYALGYDESLPFKEISLAVNANFGVDHIFELPFVQDDDTAELVACYKKNFALYSDMLVSITTNIRGRNLLEGDIITLTAPEYLLFDDTFVVQGISKSLDQFTYHLRSYSASIFSTEVIAPPTAWSGKTTTIKGPKTLAGSVVLGDGDTRPGTLTLQIADTKGDTYIAAGKTDFTNTDTGFIIGIDDSDANKAKFYIGSNTKYLNWDGADLVLRPGEVRILSGADIVLVGDDTTPGVIRWDGTSYDIQLFANTTGTSVVLRPTTADVVSCYLGQPAYEFDYIQIFAATEIRMIVDEYPIYIDGANYSIYANTTTKTVDLGTALLAYDDVYADDFQNVADFPHLDDRDDLAVIRNIKGSGVIDERTGLEIIDDDTLPDWLLSIYKRDYEGVKKGEIMRDPDGKPYLALKNTIGLLLGAIRQLDSRLTTLEETR